MSIRGQLLLVRHGQASAGSENYDRLSENGRIQSRRLAKWALERFGAPQQIFVGSLVRQQQTSASVCEVMQNSGIECPPVVVGYYETDALQ